MLPLAPALEVITIALCVNVASIVWFACTSVKVYEPADTAAGSFTPSTSTSAMR